MQCFKGGNQQEVVQFRVFGVICRMLWVFTEFPYFSFILSIKQF